MRGRRRYVFATPFVAIACAHPAPAPAPAPEPEPEPMPAPAPAPRDAAVDAITSASPCDTGPPRCPTFNPPSPKRDAGVTPTFNPPAFVRSRVLRVDVSGDHLVVTISATGEQDPQHWRAELVTDQGAPVPGGEIALERCDRRSCTGTCTLTFDQVRMHPEARFSVKPSR